MKKNQTRQSDLLYSWPSSACCAGEGGAYVKGCGVLSGHVPQAQREGLLLRGGLGVAGERSASAQAKTRNPVKGGSHRGMSRLTFLGGPKTAKSLFPKGNMMRFANVQGHGEWDQEGWALLLDRYSKSTMAVYRSQYRWWQLFCRRRGIDPVRYVTHYDRQEEDLFLGVYGALLRQRAKAPGTVKIRMAAIRSVHLSMGLPGSYGPPPENPTGDGRDQEALGY